MLTMEKTTDYVKHWVAAFESKDLDRVLAFYTDDVIFHSPLIARLTQTDRAGGCRTPGRQHRFGRIQGDRDRPDFETHDRALCDTSSW